MSIRQCIVCFFFFLLCAHGYGQTPTLTINSSNITNEISINDNSFNGNSCLLSIGGYVKARASGNLTDASTGKTIPLSKIKLYITEIGGSLLVLLTTNHEISLSTSDQTLFSNVLGLVAGNDVHIRYRITQSDMTSSAWEAGTYTTNIIFTIPGGVLCLGTPSTFTVPFTVTISPFITAQQSPSSLTLNVNNLSYYRQPSGPAITIDHSFSMVHTVPYKARVQTGSNTLSYTPVAANAALTPNTNVNLVSVQANGGYGSQINLSTSLQDLLSSGVAVAAGNQSSRSFKYGITSANLKSGFTAAGTYNATLTYNMYDSHTPPPTLATTQTPSANLTINVSEMAELLVNDADVTLQFSNANDYVNGISVDKNNHLTVSQTIPYDVYVKSSGAQLINGGNNIPASIIRIGPASGQTGVSQVQLSTTPQKIVDGALPVVDRNLSIKYSIPASDVNQVLNKPAGTYNTTVIFSFTAL